MGTRRLIDPQFVGRSELDAVEAMPHGEMERQTRERHPPIDDVATAIHWWNRAALEGDDDREPPYLSDDDAWGEDVPGQGDVLEPYRAPAKVGRNDLCPCGSGKKYKKCCGR